jgi:hypothetical protein
MSEEQEQPSFLQRLIDKRNEWAEQQPSLAAEVKAMAREGVKDIRSTINEVFLGSPELGGEPGTPMNPTPQQVTEDLGNVYGSYKDRLEDATSRGMGSKEQDKGLER